MSNWKPNSGFVSLALTLLMCGTTSAASLIKGSITRTQNNGCFERFSNNTFTATTPSVVVVVHADPLIFDLFATGASLSGGPATVLPAVNSEDRKSLYQVFTNLTPGLLYTVDAGFGCIFPNGTMHVTTFEVYEFLCPGGPSQPIADPEVPLYSWTLSASSTDPFVNRGTSPQSTLHVWLVCSPPEGVSGAEFRLYGGTIASKVLASGVLNVGTGNDLVLGFAGCLTAPKLVASLTLSSPTSDAWLGPTVGFDAAMTSLACGSSEFQCAQVVGFGTSFVRKSPNFCGALPVTQQVFWTVRGGTHGIERSDVSGGGRQTIVPTGQVAPTGIVAVQTGNWAIAPYSAFGTLYWAQAVTAELIREATLDGSDAADVVTSGLASPWDLALGAGGNLYWIDSEAPYDGIYKASISGGIPESVASGILDGRGLALDVSGSKLYWTDLATDSIHCANLDGSYPAPFLSFAANSLLGDIDFDPVARQLYWADTGLKTISRSIVDGPPSAVTILSSTNGLSFPNHLALDVYARKLFWSDYGTNSIRRASFAGTGIVDIATGIMSIPHGIALARSPVSSDFRPGARLVDQFGDPSSVIQLVFEASQGSFAEASVQIGNLGGVFSKGMLIADCPEFSIVGDPSFALMPLDTAQFTIRFTPTSTESPAAELRIAEDCGLSSRLLLIGEVPAPSPAPDAVVTRYALHGSQPNPFNASTVIRFDLLRPGKVVLDIFDVAGRRVRRLCDQVHYEAGRHQALWNGRDDHDQSVASGVYVCRIQAGSFTATKRLALVK